jgi:hypothetical protein
MSIDGGLPLMLAEQEATPMLRLFVSPVKPVKPVFALAQEGAFVVPSLTLVLRVSSVPRLKMAWELQQSPNTLNSAAVHCPCKSRTLSWLDAKMEPTAVSMVTVSEPLVTPPVRTNHAKSPIVCTGTEVAVLFE